MANMNEKNSAVKGRNPNSGDNRPSFAVPEVQEAAVWVEKDGLTLGSSILDLVSGKPGDESAQNIEIKSDRTCLNGLVVRGGEYFLKDSKMELYGWGCSDFTSKGAGALVYDKGRLTLENVDITTYGATRTATTATSGGILKVYNSRLDTHGGPLPPDYVPVIGPGMMEPPTPLGLAGNCRTHLSMDSSETYFYNCEISAAAWGAVSTDSSGGYVYCEANDCKINVSGNGYGVYADNGCHVRFNGCVIKTGNMAVIQDGNSSVTFYNTAANCQKCGMMFHGGMESYADVGLIAVEGGGLVCNDAVFLAKSTNVDIYVKEAELESKSGVLLKTMITDDEHYYQIRSKGGACYGIQATFEETELNGDMLCEDTERKTCISLVNSILTGKITGSPSFALYGDSKWLATADSTVVLTGPINLKSIDACRDAVITAISEKGCGLHGEYVLNSGGKLILK